jgi:hypothetical protein
LLSLPAHICEQGRLQAKSNKKRSSFATAWSQTTAIISLNLLVSAVAVINRKKAESTRVLFARPIMHLEDFLASQRPHRRRKLLPHSNLIRRMREDHHATYEEIRLFLQVAHSLKVTPSAIRQHCDQWGIKLGGGASTSCPSQAAAVAAATERQATDDSNDKPHQASRPLVTSANSETMSARDTIGAKAVGSDAAFTAAPQDRTTYDEREKSDAGIATAPPIDPRRSVWDQAPRAPSPAALLRMQNLKR